MKNGFKNEYDFVKVLDLKKFSELNPMLSSLITDLFGNVRSSSVIRSWVCLNKQKTDIFIKINRTVRRVSIKMGSRNSVHVEEVKTFTRFLVKNKIPIDVIEKFLRYQYADGTIDNTGLDRMSSYEYKEKFQSEIDYMNNYFNNEKLVEKVIDRCVLRGRFNFDDVDAIIFGVPNDFIWILKDDIKKIITNKKSIYSSAPHFGSLVYQPFDRCLNRNPKYEHAREYIQVKWYSLFDNIIENMNNKVMNNQKLL